MTILCNIGRNYGGNNMVDINNICVIGGDKRQIAMAESMSLDGYNVFVAGFDKINFYNGTIKSSVDEAIEKSECIVFPLPVTKDYITLNAPFADTKIILNDQFAEKLKGKKVFCGMASRLYNISEVWNDISIYDYSIEEEFMVKNAVPTAEGAIEIAMREYVGTINGSKCLVTGFGRIGKVLSSMLKGLGADVTVSARKKEDLAFIKLSGYTPIHTSKIYKTRGYDLIFNTIPHLVFDARTLAFSAENALIIDLASAPGGIDLRAAERLAIKTIQALSLPGKVAPKTAGETIKSTVYNMLSEEDGG